MIKAIETQLNNLSLKLRMNAKYCTCWHGKGFPGHK